MTEAIKHIVGTCGENHLNIYHIVILSIAFLSVIKYKLIKNK